MPQGVCTIGLHLSGAANVPCSQPFPIGAGPRGPPARWTQAGRPRGGDIHLGLEHWVQFRPEKGAGGILLVSGRATGWRCQRMGSAEAAGFSWELSACQEGQVGKNWEKLGRQAKVVGC